MPKRRLGYRIVQRAQAARLTEGPRHRSRLQTQSPGWRLMRPPPAACGGWEWGGGQAANRQQLGLGGVSCWREAAPKCCMAAWKAGASSRLARKALKSSACWAAVSVRLLLGRQTPGPGGSRGWPEPQKIRAAGQRAALRCRTLARKRPKVERRPFGGRGCGRGGAGPIAGTRRPRPGGA